jgi:hypothetical protein
MDSFVNQLPEQPERRSIACDERVSRGERMSRLRHTLGALLAGTLIAAAGSQVSAQDTVSPDVALRAQMAAITLDGSALPGGYIFVGETFLTAEQSISGDLTADDLTGAGFVSQYVSTYRNPDNGFEISSYVSAWSDGAAAEAGFALIEDEAQTHPDGELTDGDAPVGESPGESTTGTYPDSADASVTVNTSDVTFRADRFLVGVSLETRDGSEAATDTVNTLAGTLEGRATSVIGNENPEGTDLALTAQAVPLFGLGSELQAGFLDTGDVEGMYGLQGSALSDFTASWTEAVGLGEGDALQPYISVSLTSFGSAEAATAIIDQIGDLAPDVPNVEPVDGVEVEGSDAVAAFSFPSLATGATEADSFRIVTVADTALVVIDVQGAPSVEIAQETAAQLATAQLACVGESSCAAPELPADLAG